MNRVSASQNSHNFSAVIAEKSKAASENSWPIKSK